MQDETSLPPPTKLEGWPYRSLEPISVVLLTGGGVAGRGARLGQRHGKEKLFPLGLGQEVILVQ